MSNKYYIYLHKRLDKNEVFYVGKGTLTGKFSLRCIYSKVNLSILKNNKLKS